MHQHSSSSHPTIRRIAAAVTLTALSTAATVAQQPTPKAALAENYGKLPLSFEANQGQTDPQVKFLSKGNGYTLFLTDKSAVLALTKTEKWPSDDQKKSGCPILTDHTATGKPCESKVGKGGMPQNSKSSPTKTDIVRMELTGSNQPTKVEGNQQLPGTANYFLGNDPSKWHTNVPTYSKVSYKNVYPGVDLLYYGNQRQLEYDFVVQPQVNPKQIKLHFAGAKKLTLNQYGDLEVTATNGQIAFQKPVIYQIKRGQRQPVEGTFTLLAKNEVGFQIGTYDQSQELVIDPTLEYSTYLGGSTNDFANAIAVDSSGNAYVTGVTQSTNFPLSSSPYQGTNKDATNGNVFVTKLNPAGTALVYSTYVGGSTSCSRSSLNIDLLGDMGNGIAVDATGDAYITGQACSTDFPTTKGAFQTVNNAGSADAPNAFVTKLNPSGTELVYSTYLGGSGYNGSGDFALSIASDSSGNAYIGGTAFSTNFPVTKGAFQTINNTTPGDAAFISKLNPAGSALVYSTYLSGGSGPSAIIGIATDTAGDAYLTGYVQSASFPVTKNAYQSSFHGTAGNVNAFVTKLNPTGTGLLYSTYLGGSGDGFVNYGDRGNSIGIDDSGNAYIAGSAYSHDFPTTSGAYQTKSKVPVGQPTGFASKVDTKSGALVYSTYLGGSGGDSANSVVLDAKGDAFVTGDTYSYASTSTIGFPVTSGAYQPDNDASINKASNAFFTELNPAGDALVYSTYLGGAGTTSGNGDSGNGIALDSFGNVYIAGTAYSTKFPTTKGAFQTKMAATTGNSNAFIAKFAFATATTTTLVSDGNPEPLGAKVVFTADVTGDDGTPTGTVSFAIDGGKPIVVDLDDTGHAAYSTTTLTEGVHTVVATYSGDALNSPSTSNTVSETIDSNTPTATPTVSQTITIADATKGYAVYYTTNGTTPTTASTKYTGPITITASETLKFIAVAPGYTPSAVRTVTDTIQ